MTAVRQLVADPMTELQFAWNATLARGFQAGPGVGPAVFQTHQPSTPIPATDAGLWTVEDTLPPPTVINDGNCCGDCLFEEYRALATELQFPESQFETDIGPTTFIRWSTYVEATHPDATAAELPGIFRDWSLVNAPDVTAVGVSDLTRMALIDDAQQALGPYSGPNGRPPDFLGGYLQLLAALAATGPRKVVFDTADPSDPQGSTRVDRTGYCRGLWADACPTGRLSTVFAASTISLTATFARCCQWVCTPGPWYNSWLLNLAYSSPTVPPWPPVANPTWAELFGPVGSLQRTTASLYVADGVHATWTSDATFRPRDQRVIAEKASTGLWPFYLPSSPSTTANQVTFDRQGRMRGRIDSDGNQPLVLGSSVLSTSSYLGHGV